MHWWIGPISVNYVEFIGFDDAPSIPVLQFGFGFSSFQPQRLHQQKKKEKYPHRGSENIDWPTINIPCGRIPLAFWTFNYRFSLSQWISRFFVVWFLPSLSATAHQPLPPAPGERLAVSKECCAGCAALRWTCGRNKPATLSYACINIVANQKSEANRIGAGCPRIF